MNSLNSLLVIAAVQWLICFYSKLSSPPFQHFIPQAFDSTTLTSTFWYSVPEGAFSMECGFHQPFFCHKFSLSHCGFLAAELRVFWLKVQSFKFAAEFTTIFAAVSKDASVRHIIRSACLYPAIAESHSLSFPIIAYHVLSPKLVGMIAGKRSDTAIAPLSGSRVPRKRSLAVLIGVSLDARRELLAGSLTDSHLQRKLHAHRERPHAEPRQPTNG